MNIKNGSTTQVVTSIPNLYEQSVRAFDYLVLKHGFSKEDLCAKNDHLKRLGYSNEQRWIWFLELLKDCEKQARAGKRKYQFRNPFDALDYYDQHEVATMLQGNISLRRLAKLPREKTA